MASAFKVGDLAQLKSGSPIMTVKWLSSDGRAVTCQWFSGSKLNEGTFSTDSLVAAKKKADE